MARAMMARQLDYALERLDDAFHEILGDQPRDDEGKDRRENADLIRNGTVKITPALLKRAFVAFDAEVRKNKRWHGSITGFIEGEICNAINKARKPTLDKEIKKWNARKYKLRIKYIEAKDELILGDVERALKLIEAFRKTKV